MNNELLKLLQNKTNFTQKVIENIIKLLEDGCTIPFIARYRKEFTNNATDEELRIFEDIYSYSQKLIQRKDEILTLLDEKKFLNEKIKKQIDEALSLQNLEDIYSPFKNKKSSRTSNAIENGLEPLANIIQCLKYTKEECQVKAKKFLNKDIISINDAIKGAQDIIAQRYADDYKSKDIVRNILLNWGTIQIKKAKNFEENSVYSAFINSEEKIKYIKPHRTLAILRGTNEKQLNIKIEIDEIKIIENIKKYKIPTWSNTSKDYVFESYKDGLKRLLLPSIKREILNTLKEKASKESIELFGKNLKELLQTAPLVNQVILGIDPGYKTGCKIAVIDENAQYLDCAVIYPTKPKEDIKTSNKIVLGLIKKYNVTAIAIGNGTASRETASFIANLKKEEKLNINFAIVSEIGASIYSASKIASLEYPTLDVTIRGAISIASRLRDPMAALVKIDPKSLGIGQYQHDVNQKELTKKLENITIDLVNKVGVDINSASYKLLSFVSGISEKLAQNIIAHKKALSKFSSKEQLIKVKGFGSKAYEQSIGFLRIKDGNSILDNTGIHPEDYQLTKKLQSLYTIEDIKNDEIEIIANKLNSNSLKIKDIINELKKPGFDIRENFNQIIFSNDITKIEDLKEGFIISGIVRNITDFGAFVDIGLKNDALLHISQISQKRISHPSDLLSINQNLENIKVINIDLKKQRVSISLK